MNTSLIGRKKVDLTEPADGQVPVYRTATGIYAPEDPPAGSPYEAVLLTVGSGGAYETIKAAIDAISDSGPSKPYMLLLHAGVHIVTDSTLVRPGLNISFVGRGKDLTTIKLNTTGSNIPIYHSYTDCEYRDLTIEDNGQGVPNYGFIYLDEGSAGSTAFRNVRFTFTSTTGTYAAITCRRANTVIFEENIRKQKAQIAHTIAKGSY